MDMGGHRFFSKHSRVTDWWFNVLPLQGHKSFDDEELNRDSEIRDDGPDPAKVDDVMLIRNRVSRIYFNHKFFDYPIKMNLNTVRNLGLITTIKCGLGYIKSCIFKKPEVNLENFYINRFGKPLYKMFFEGYTEKLWGRHPREISADWGAQRVKGLNIQTLIKNMISKQQSEVEKETSLIERFYYPKFGPGQLWEKALRCAEDNGVKVLLGTKLVGVKTDGNRVSQIDIKMDVQTGDKGTIFEYNSIDCDSLISSVPLKELVGCFQSEVISQNSQKIANGLPYRDFMTCGILVDKLAVKNETDIATYRNQIPDCWIYIQDTSVAMGRVQIFNNWQPYMVVDAKNKIWIGTEYFCNVGDNLWKMNDCKFSELAVRELKQIGLIDDSTKIEMTHVERVEKAYPAYFDTYSKIDKLKDEINSIDGLLCIGRNGQHRYNNMDHSMITAFTAVDILENVPGATKKSLWEVNTEREYHEEK